MGHQHNNRLLSELSKGELSLLETSLEAVELAQHETLEQPNRRIKNIYFIERGMASVIAQRGSEQVEIAVIGREGMTGLAIVMDTDRSPQRTVMQVEGGGLRIAVRLMPCSSGDSTANAHGRPQMCSAVPKRRMNEALRRHSD